MGDREAMSAAEIVTTFWAALEGRDWERAAEFLAPDVTVEMPDTGRVFHGREAFMEFNRNYPGDWHVTVQRTIATADEVAAEVSAINNGVREACLGFYTLRHGQITHAKEWWLTLPTKRGYQLSAISPLMPPALRLPPPVVSQ